MEPICVVTMHQTTLSLFSDAGMEWECCWSIWKVQSPLFKAHLLSSPILTHGTVDVLSVSCKCLSVESLSKGLSIWKIGISLLNRTKLEEEKFQFKFTFTLNKYPISKRWKNSNSNGSWVHQSVTKYQFEKHQDMFKVKKNQDVINYNSSVCVCMDVCVYVWIIV